MTTVEEVMQLCRLCLVKDKVNVPIFEEDVEIRQILTKINTLLPVKVSRNDNLPKLICKDCSSKLDMLYMFRKTSVESDKQLHSWLSSGPKETKPEVSVKQENFESTESRIEDEQVDAAAFLMQQEFEELDESGLEQESVRKKFKRTPKSAVETDDEDFDEGMAAKPEDDDSDEMDQTDYAEDPSVGTDDEQPGPSGVVKEATETPAMDIILPKGITIRRVVGNGKSQVKQDNMKRVRSTRPLDLSSMKYICMKCPNLFATYDALEAHLRASVCTPPKHYRCSTCDKTFTTGSNLRAHMVKHENDSENNCTKCGRYFANFIARDAHYETMHTEHYDSTLTGMKCKICDYETGNSINKILKHINSTHYPVSSLLCDQCGKSFDTKYNLNTHVLTMHTGDEKLFQCQYCEKTFKMSKQRNAHEKKHIEEKSYECSQCGKIYKNLKSVKHHLILVHGIVV